VSREDAKPPDLEKKAGQELRNTSVSAPSREAKRTGSQAKDDRDKRVTIEKEEHK